MKFWGKLVAILNFERNVGRYGNRGFRIIAEVLEALPVQKWGVDWPAEGAPENPNRGVEISTKTLRAQRLKKNQDLEIFKRD